MNNRLIWAAVLLLVAMTAWATTARDAYQRGQEQLQNRNYTAAVGEFRAAVSRNESYLDAWLGLSEAFLNLQEFDQALEAVTAARRLAGNSVQVKNLHADVLLSLGRIEPAAQLYAEVRSVEPNNIDAVIGEAQIQLAHNRPEQAMQTFSQALRQSPRNRTALLSLALLAEASGNYSAAENYIEAALTHHNDNAAVHYMAARHQFNRNNLEHAQYHAATALGLRDMYPDAMLLQGEIFIHMEQFSQAVSVMQQLLSHNPNHTLAWYIHAIAELQRDDVGSSLHSFERALGLDPGNEIVRSVYETVLRRNTDLHDDRRKTAARYHNELAAGYGNQYAAQRARIHYRRALQIDPFSETARRGFAAAYETDGLYARYLSELSVLRDHGIEDQGILDSVAIYESLRLDSVASRWNIEQMDLERLTTQVQLFVIGSITGYPLLSTYLAEYAQDFFSADSRIAFTNSPVAVDSEQQAYEIARAGSADYFLILRPAAFDPGIKLTTSVFVSRTGNKIYSDTIIRDGSQYVSRALWAAREGSLHVFPIQAKLIDRRFRTAVIDRGKSDGIEVGDRLPLYPARSGIPRSDGPGLLFPEDSQLAIFSVEQLDDMLAEGRIIEGGFFDRVSVGDVAVRQPEVDVEQRPELAAFPPLYRQIRALD